MFILELVFVLVPMITYALVAVGVSVSTKKQFGYCIPLAFISLSLITYVGQFVFHTFQFGFYVAVALVVISISLMLAQKDGTVVSRKLV